MPHVSWRLSLVAPVACAALLGCGPSRVALWPERWTQCHVDVWWEHGFSPGDRQRFEVPGGGYLFRCRALNPAGAAGEVRLAGPQGAHTWSVPAGGTADVEWPTAGKGPYSLDVSPGVILAEPRLVRPRRRAPLVVLMLADTLRGDCVNERLTPGLLAAFRDGERFVDASSNATWTLPSVASLFTSRPTIELSAVDGGLVAIPEGVTSWAEALHAKGFVGGAVVANYTVNVPNDFGKGFDSFVVPMHFGPSGHPLAEQVLGQARAWLRAHRGEPAFVYLQFMDQHEPYHDHEGGMPPMAPIGPLASRAREASPEETRQRRAAYDATVHYLDGQLAPFLAELPPQAVAAFTADHGEAFGEHGCWGHGLNLYQEAVHVPLLLRGPGVPSGVERRPVQLLDLSPTLLDLAGCPLPAGMVGRSLLRGGSAAPIVSVTFGAGPLRWAWRDGARKVVVHTRTQPGLAPASEVTMQEVRPLPTGAFLFDLARDPGERHPEPLDAATALAAARVFAGSAGKLVPGLQVLAADRPGPTSVALRCPASVRPAQVFSVGAASVSRSGDRLEIRWEDAFPFALAGLTAPAALQPTADPLDSWRWLADGPPADPSAGGVFVWWNQRDRSLQRGYEETLTRLRNLGYLQ